LTLLFREEPPSMGFLFWDFTTRRLATSREPHRPRCYTPVRITLTYLCSGLYCLRCNLLNRTPVLVLFETCWHSLRSVCGFIESL
jgi:hypothetical protein